MWVDASLLFAHSWQDDDLKSGKRPVGDVGGYDGSECGLSGECAWPDRTDSPASRLLQVSAFSFRPTL